MEIIKLYNRNLYFFFLLITTAMAARTEGLRFGKKSGEFKIIQVADMHYADGRSTSCLDVFPSQEPTCSDLNTTDFLYRVFRAENPDLVVFTGKPPTDLSAILQIPMQKRPAFAHYCRGNGIELLMLIDSFLWNELVISIFMQSATQIVKFAVYILLI